MITTLLGSGFCPMAGRYKSYECSLQFVDEVGKGEQNSLPFLPFANDGQVTLESRQDKHEYLFDKGMFVLYYIFDVL